MQMNFNLLERISEWNLRFQCVQFIVSAAVFLKYILNKLRNKRAAAEALLSDMTE